MTTSRYARRAFTAETFDESLVRRESGRFARKDATYGDALQDPPPGGWSPDNLPPSVKFSPTLRNEASHELRGGEGITVGQKFFDLSPAQQQGVLAHEVGHGLSDEMLRDGSAFDLYEKAKEQHPAPDLGAGATPGEFLADVYMALWSDRDFVEGRFPGIPDAVEEAAARYGYPRPARRAGLFDPDEHPREEDGKFAYDGGREDRRTGERDQIGEPKSDRAPGTLTKNGMVVANGQTVKVGDRVAVKHEVGLPWDRFVTTTYGKVKSLSETAGVGVKLDDGTRLFYKPGDVYEGKGLLSGKAPEHGLAETLSRYDLRTITDVAAQTVGGTVDGFSVGDQQFDNQDAMAELFGKHMRASVSRFARSAFAEWREEDHPRGEGGRFAEKTYEFVVDYAADKDSMDKVSGSAHVRVSARNPTEGRLVAEQMVASRGVEPVAVQEVPPSDAPTGRYEAEDVPATVSSFDDVRTGEPVTIVGWRTEGGSTMVTPELEEALGRDQLLGNGLYFTDNPDAVSSFGGDLTQVTVRLNNPYVAQVDEIDPDEYEYAFDAWSDVAAALPDPAFLQRQGYDGIVLTGGPVMGEDLREAVAFNGDAMVSQKPARRDESSGTWTAASRFAYVEWNPEDHPRGEGGRFVTSDGEPAVEGPAFATPSPLTQEERDAFVRAREQHGDYMVNAVNNRLVMDRSRYRLAQIGFLQEDENGTYVTARSEGGGPLIRIPLSADMFIRSDNPPWIEFDRSVFGEAGANAISGAGGLAPSSGTNITPDEWTTVNTAMRADELIPGSPTIPGYDDYRISGVSTRTVDGERGVGITALSNADGTRVDAFVPLGPQHFTDQGLIDRSKLAVDAFAAVGNEIENGNFQDVRDYESRRTAESEALDRAMGSAEQILQSALPEDFIGSLDARGRTGTFTITDPDGYGGNISFDVVGDRLHISSMVFDPEVQNRGLGTAMVGAIISAAEQLPVDYVEFLANISVGGYAWARMGAYPSSWGSLKGEISSRLAMGVSVGLVDEATDVKVRGLLDGPPTNLPDIAALDTKVNLGSLEEEPRNRSLGQPIFTNLRLDENGEIELGKALLLGTSWPAQIPIGDAAAREDFAQYQRDKEAEEATKAARAAAVEQQGAGAYRKPDGTLDDASFWAEVLSDDTLAPADEKRVLRGALQAIDTALAALQTARQAYAEFREEDHPRGEHGRFTNKDTPGGVTEEDIANFNAVNGIPTAPPPSPADKTRVQISAGVDRIKSVFPGAVIRVHPEITDAANPQPGVSFPHADPQTYVDAVNGVATGFERMAADYPEIAARIGTIELGPTDSGHDALGQYLHQGSGQKYEGIAPAGAYAGQPRPLIQVDIDAIAERVYSLQGTRPQDVVTHTVPAANAGLDTARLTEGIAIHEFGHAVYYAAPSAVQMHATTDVAFRTGQYDAHISDYAGASPHEYFSEAFAANELGLGDRLTDADRNMLAVAGVDVAARAAAAVTEDDPPPDTFEGSIVWEYAKREPRTSAFDESKWEREGGRFHRYIGPEPAEKWVDDASEGARVRTLRPDRLADVRQRYLNEGMVRARLQAAYPNARLEGQFPGWLDVSTDEMEWAIGNYDEGSKEWVESQEDADAIADTMTGLYDGLAQVAAQFPDQAAMVTEISIDPGLLESGGDAETFHSPDATRMTFSYASFSNEPMSDTSSYTIADVEAQAEGSPDRYGIPRSDTRLWAFGVALHEFGHVLDHHAAEVEHGSAFTRDDFMNFKFHVAGAPALVAAWDSDEHLGEAFQYAGDVSTYAKTEPAEYAAEAFTLSRLDPYALPDDARDVVEWLEARAAMKVGDRVPVMASVQPATEPDGTPGILIVDMLRGDTVATRAAQGRYGMQAAIGGMAEIIREIPDKFIEEKSPIGDRSRRAYAEWDPEDHPRGEGGRFSVKDELQDAADAVPEIPIAPGASVDDVMRSLRGDVPEFGYSPSSGEVTYYPGVMREGMTIIPPAEGRERSEVRWDGAEPIGQRNFGFGADRDVFAPTIIRASREQGEPFPNLTAEPPKALFRAVSEADWQRIVQQGVLDTTGPGLIESVPESGTRMNADFEPVTSYLPWKGSSYDDGSGAGRVLRIRYEASDGWYVDPTVDGYARTDQPIPLDRIEMVSPVIVGDEQTHRTIQAALSRFARRAYAPWREEDHPRGDRGRFINKEGEIERPEKVDVAREFRAAIKAEDRKGRVYGDYKTPWNDTSPKNAPGMRKADEVLWSRGAPKPYVGDGGGQYGRPNEYMISAAADKMGLDIPGAVDWTEGRPAYDEGRYVPPERIERAAENLLKSIANGEPSQPVLWRGVREPDPRYYRTSYGGYLEDKSRPIEPSLADWRPKAGDVVTLPPMSFSRSATTASMYGDKVVIRVEPGATGYAVRNEYPWDAEVVTAGTFQVRDVQRAGGTTYINMEQVDTP